MHRALLAFAAAVAVVLGVAPAAEAASLTTINFHVCMPAIAGDRYAAEGIGAGSVSLISSTYTTGFQLWGPSATPRDSDGCWSKALSFPTGGATLQFGGGSYPSPHAPGECYPTSWQMSQPLNLSANDTIAFTVPNPTAVHLRVLTPEGAEANNAWVTLPDSGPLETSTLPVTTSSGSSNATLVANQYNYYVPGSYGSGQPCYSGTDVLTFNQDPTTQVQANVQYVMPQGTQLTTLN